MDISLGITIGDPAGIGPEVLLKALPSLRRIPRTRFLVIGDASVLDRTAALLGKKPALPVVHSTADIGKQKIVLLSCDIVGKSACPPGTDSRHGGGASFRYVERGVGLWRERIIDGLVTLPISKRAWHLAGRNYPGHTEYLAEAAGTHDYAMIMAAGPVRAVLATTHIPFSRIPAALSRDLIVRQGMIGNRFLRESGVPAPKIGVAALNPHAGEGGLLGTEERTIILPAVRELVRRGINASGPFPADAVFTRALRGDFDLVVTLYHDQAMIPLKTFFSGRLVNITAGLPFVRTSPGHGTAFDIAGQGKADPSAFLSACRVAATLVIARKKTAAGTAP